MAVNQYQTRKSTKHVFAAEYDDALYEDQDGESETAARMSLLPTGEWANRVLIAGTVVSTEEDTASSGSKYVRADIRDPTGTFSVIAGEQYSNEQRERLLEISPPQLAFVTGKTDVYTDEAEDIETTNIDVEEITPISEDVLYDQWVATTAIATLNRLDDFDPTVYEAAALCSDVYDPNLEQYRDAAQEACRQIKEYIREATNTQTA
jgi:RPA family protein